ncbi:MAG: hypothetical protein K2M09_07135, partial [Muribaculaceae bacterium]|nr:hypothetical protein [Muribaculaceae bacterium]
MKKNPMMTLALSLLSSASLMAASPDLSKVRFTVGEGSETCLLVMRCNVANRMDNFVYAVQSDSEDLTALEALALVKEADDRMMVQIGDSQATVSIDLTGDSKTEFDDKDIKDIVLTPAAGSTMSADGSTRV